MGYCDACHQRFLQYQKLSSDLIPAMAGAAASERDEAPFESPGSIDAAEQRLLREFDSRAPQQGSARKTGTDWRIPAGLLAACLTMFACWAAIHYAHSKNPASPQMGLRSDHESIPQGGRLGEAVTRTSQALVQNQDAVASLNTQVAALKDQLRQATVALEIAQKHLAAEQANVKAIGQERDMLRGQLSVAKDDAGSLREKLASQGANMTQQGTRIAALETQVHSLNASLEDTRQELNEKTQLLSLDKEFLDHVRDIRDVIGARNLYIADITDINSNGKQARQFGRIFYTKDKSLLFYGFDLDGQAGHKQDVSYQVWGSSTDRSAPVSLGLFFQDDAHKRWVLRCNDAKMLARLNMVFVTVEPPGGSARPTGKQLLRTYLQIQPNHP